MPADVLGQGDERAPRLPPRAAPVLLGALAVALAGVAAVPGVRDRAAAASAPAVVTAVPSGGSAIGGQLRVWLLLEGPPSAVVQAVAADLPGSRVSPGSVPDRFTGRGFAAVRLDVDPECPAALQGLGRGSLRVRVDDGRERGPSSLTVPFDTGGILEATVRARCAGLLGPDDAGTGPFVRSAGPGGAGALRTVVEIGAPGPAVVVVQRVTPGPGLVTRVVTPLPLRVPVGTRRELVVEVGPGSCEPDAARRDRDPPFLLETTTDGEVVPRVDPGLAGRLSAARRARC